MLLTEQLRAMTILVCLILGGGLPTQIFGTIVGRDTVSMCGLHTFRTQSVPRLACHDVHTYLLPLAIFVCGKSQVSTRSDKQSQRLTSFSVYNTVSIDAVPRMTGDWPAFSHT